MNQAKGQEPKPLLQQIEQAIDPDGELKAVTQAFAVLAGNRFTRLGLRALGIDVDRIAALEDDRRRLVEQAAAVMDALVPLGWAVPQYIAAETLLAAVTAVAEKDEAKADRLLCQALSDGFSLNRAIAQVGSMGSADKDYAALFAQRRRLLLKAKDHHEAGAYEAAIPIVLAQIEGITADVTGGKMFFSRDDRRMADVVDESILSAVPGHLAALRDYYSRSGHVTRASGSLSRHEILHGRELTYDTEVNSLKVFMLLEAVIHWAKPRADAEGERFREARWQANAGSDEHDDDGRRVDDREFSATRQALRWIWVCHAGWYRRRGRFREDMLDIALGGTDAQRLPTPHGVEMRVADDGQSFWAWRRTVSGWYLGIGADIAGKLGQPDAEIAEWLWDAADAPATAPAVGIPRWSSMWDDTPANWR